MNLSDVINNTPLNTKAAIVAEVTNPETEFGGVLISMPSEIPILVDFSSGVGPFGPFPEIDYPVTSVFGRLKDIIALKADYAAFYAPIEAGVPVGGLTGQVLAKLGNDDYDTGWVDIFGGIDISDFARLSLPNVFQRENTFSGIRLGRIKIITPADNPYQILPTDGVILADCTTGDVVAVLPHSTGNGQFLRLRKIDLTGNEFRTYAQSGDFINLDPSIAITEYKRGFLIEDGKPHFWDVIVPGDLVDTTIINEFENTTIFNGVQFTPKTIIDDYEIQSTDTFMVVDCSVLNKDIALLLPPALGVGQWYHIKKIDGTNKEVRIICQVGDFVGDFPGDATSINFSRRGTDCILSDDQANFWDNWGPSGIDALPPGGTIGQVLKKRSSIDFDADWEDESGGVNFGPHGRVRDLSPEWGFAFDVQDPMTFDWVEQVRYVQPGPSVVATPSMRLIWDPEVHNMIDLAAIDTVGVFDEGSRYDCDFQADPDMGTGLKSFVFRPGTADVGDPGQVNPHDYNGITNNFHWESA